MTTIFLFCRFQCQCSIFFITYAFQFSCHTHRQFLLSCCHSEKYILPARKTVHSNNSYFPHKLFFPVIFTNFVETEKLYKVRKFKDFYISFLCSPTTVSSVLSLSQSTPSTFLPFIYIGNLNRRPFNILPSFCSSS